MSEQPGTPESHSTVVPILANPYSGKGVNRRRVAKLADALGAAGLEVQTIWDADERARLLNDPERLDHCRALVSAGGDGSVADVVNDLSSGGPTDRVPIAMLPMGNENLFARQFGFNQGAQALAEAIARGRTRHIDLGCARRDGGASRYFTLMVSAGFDAEVVHRVARWRNHGSGLHRVNRFSYVPRILSAAFSYDFPLITLEADGQRHTGSHVFVFNLPQYGMGLGIAPRADGEDGLLDWIVMEKPGKPALLGYAVSVLRGRHEHRSGVHVGRAEQVKLTSPRPAPAQADGDVLGHTPVQVRVHRRAMRVIEV